MNNQLLSGKNVLITGAGPNIGKSIALEMAKEGANIYFTDVDRKRCLNLSQELETYDIEHKFYLSDICDTKEIERLCQSLQRNNIKLHILVNNVGIPSDVIGIKHLNLSEWEKVFRTNLFGPMYLTKLISEMMIAHQTQGSIIFLSSIHQSTLLRRPSYSASKAAMVMAIKELAIDLAPHSIRVNGIAPGAVGEDEAKRPRVCKSAPLHHTSINPCYIGRAAVYLASDFFSRFTTGSIIKIDAGLSLFSYLC